MGALVRQKRCVWDIRHEPACSRGNGTVTLPAIEGRVDNHASLDLDQAIKASLLRGTLLMVRAAQRASCCALRSTARCKPDRGSPQYHQGAMCNVGDPAGAATQVLSNLSKRHLRGDAEAQDRSTLVWQACDFGEQGVLPLLRFQRLLSRLAVTGESSSGALCTSRSARRLTLAVMQSTERPFEIPARQSSHPWHKRRNIFNAWPPVDQIAIRLLKDVFG